MAMPPDPQGPEIRPGGGPDGPRSGWTDEDWAYAVDGRSAPATPPRRSLLTSRRLTGILALLVVVLLAVAVLPSLGLTLPRISIDFGGGASASPTGTLPPSASAAASVSLEPTFVRPTPTAVPTFTSYVVKAGDSLGTIATLYRTTARSIAWWNRGTYPTLDPESSTYNPQVIQVGWTLVLIPGMVVDDANPPSPSPGRATPTPAASGPGASGSPSGSARPASPAPSASR